MPRRINYVELESSPNVLIDLSVRRTRFGVAGVHQFGPASDRIMRLPNFHVNVSEFKLLAVHSKRSRSELVIFENGLIPEELGSYPVPIVEAKGGMKVVLRYVRGLLPGSILCLGGPGDDRPHVIVEKCSFDASVASQEDLIHNTSLGGYVVRFRDNSSQDNSLIFPNETISA